MPCKTIPDLWVVIYTGMPHRTILDQGSFFGELFANLERISSVEVQCTGVRAHSSPDIGQRYHHVL